MLITVMRRFEIARQCVIYYLSEINACKMATEPILKSAKSSGNSFTIGDITFALHVLHYKEPITAHWPNWEAGRILTGLTG